MSGRPILGQRPGLVLLRLSIAADSKNRIRLSFFFFCSVWWLQFTVLVNIYTMFCFSKVIALIVDDVIIDSPRADMQCPHYGCSSDISKLMDLIEQDKSISSFLHLYLIELFEKNLLLIILPMNKTWVKTKKCVCLGIRRWITIPIIEWWPNKANGEIEEVGRLCLVQLFRNNENLVLGKPD